MLLYQSMRVQKITRVVKAFGGSWNRVSTNALIFFHSPEHFFAFPGMANELRELKLLTTWDQKWACVIPLVIWSECPDIKQVDPEIIFFIILLFTVGNIFPFWLSNVSIFPGFQQQHELLSLKYYFLCFISLIYFYIVWGTITWLTCAWQLCLQLVLLIVSMLSVKPGNDAVQYKRSMWPNLLFRWVSNFFLSLS